MWRAWCTQKRKLVAILSCQNEERAITRAGQNRTCESYYMRYSLQTHTNQANSYELFILLWPSLFTFLFSCHFFSHKLVELWLVWTIAWSIWSIVESHYRMHAVLYHHWMHVDHWWKHTDECTLMNARWWMITAECTLITDKWSLMNDHCWMITAECTLITEERARWWMITAECTLITDKWSLMNDHCWVITAECTLITAEWSLMNNNWWMITDECTLITHNECTLFVVNTYFPSPFRRKNKRRREWTTPDEYQHATPPPWPLLPTIHKCLVVHALHLSPQQRKRS